MESLDDVIEKKTKKSLLSFMRLVDPKCKYSFENNIIEAWNRLPLVDQRKLYLYLLYRKWRGLDIYGCPLDIVRNCHPAPFNWNQHPLCQSLIRERKAIIARYNGAYGTYTRDEATLYDMTDKQWFN